jgi:hypothetical protein
MSGPAFAEHCGLKYQTFAGWVAKRRREEGQTRPPVWCQKSAEPVNTGVSGQDNWLRSSTSTDLTKVVSYRFPSASGFSEGAGTAIPVWRIRLTEKEL